MAGYFGTGERFKHNPERIPGPGEYDPRSPEGFKVEPKSGFVGNGRFDELVKEGPMQTPDISPPRPRFRPTPGPEGRKFSWATQRISELEKDLDRSKKHVKELRAQQDKDKKEYDALLSEQHKLLQQAEAEEGKLKASLVAAQEALEDSKHRLRSSEEAHSAAEAELAAVCGEKERLEGDLAKQWQEMHAQVTEAQDARGSAEEQCTGLRATISRLGDREVETLDEAVQAVDDSLHQLATLRQRCETGEAVLAEKEADLSTQSAARGDLELKLDGTMTSVADLEGKLATCSAALAAKTSELEDVSVELKENLRLACQSHQEDKSALISALEETKALLKLQTAAAVRLETDLLTKTTECQQLTGAAEVLRLELSSLQEAQDNLAADFQQHQQDASAQYQHLSANLAAESEALAQLTTELTSSKAETQRLEALASELRNQIEKDRLAAASREDNAMRAHAALEADRAELQSQKAVLDHQVAGLSAETAAQKAQLLELTSSKNAVETKASQLETSLGTVGSELATAQGENARLQLAVAGLEEELANAQAEAKNAAETLTEQLAASTAASREIRDRNDKLETSISTLASDLAETADAKLAADAAVADLSGQVATLAAFKAELENSLAASSASLDILKAEHDKLRSAHAELSLQHSSLGTQAGSLENKVEDLEAELSAEKKSCGRLEAVCNGLRGDVAQAAAAKAAADQELAALQGSNKAMEASLADLNARLAEGKSQQAALESELTNVRQGFSESKAANLISEARVAELVTEAEVLEAAKLAVESTKGELEKQLEDAEKHRRAAELQVEELQISLVSTTDSHATAKGEIDILNVELATSCASNDRLQAALAEELAAKSEAEAAAAKLLKELKASQSEFRRVSAGHEDAMLALQDAATLVQDSKATLAREQSKHADLGQKAAKLAEENLAAAELVRSLRADLVAATARAAASEKEAEASTAAKELLNQQLSALHAQFGELEEFKQALQADNESLSNANAGLETAAAGLKMDLDGEQNSNAELHATVAELQSHLVQSETNAKDLAAKLDETAALMTAQEAEIQELKVSNHKYRAKRQQLQEQVNELSVASPGFSESNTAELHSLQEEVLDMHESMRVLEARAIHAEELLEQKTCQFAQLQEQLLDVEDEAAVCRASGSEAQRLTEENSLLAGQLRQLEINLQDLMGTSGIGHSNPKQKLQYHLRLKQELEEMRHECMQLLRERFHLEQCVRYLAARSVLPRRVVGDLGIGSVRSPLQKNPVQPASLRKHTLFATPSRRQSMLRSSRGRAASELGIAPSKEEIVASIKQTVSMTASSYRTLTEDVEHTADNNKENAAANNTPRHKTLLSRTSTVVSDEPESPTSSATSEADPAGRKGIESRIVAKIVEICSPNKTGRTSRLMMLDHQPDEERALSALATPAAASGRPPLGNADALGSMSVARGSMTVRSIWK